MAIPSSLWNAVLNMLMQSKYVNKFSIYWCNTVSLKILISGPPKKVFVKMGNVWDFLKLQKY